MWATTEAAAASKTRPEIGFTVRIPPYHILLVRLAKVVYITKALFNNNLAGDRRGLGEGETWGLGEGETPSPLVP